MKMLFRGTILLSLILTSCLQSNKIQSSKVSIPVPDSLALKHITLQGWVGAHDNRVILYDIFTRNVLLVNRSLTYIDSVFKPPYPAFRSAYWVTMPSKSKFITLNQYNDSNSNRKVWVKSYEKDSLYLISFDDLSSWNLDTSLYICNDQGNTQIMRGNKLLIPFQTSRFSIDHHKTWALAAVDLNTNQCISIIHRKFIYFEEGYNEQFYTNYLYTYTSWINDSVVLIGHNYSSRIYQWNINQNVLFDSFECQVPGVEFKDLVQPRNYFGETGQHSAFGSLAGFGQLFYNPGNNSIYRFSYAPPGGDFRSWHRKRYIVSRFNLNLIDHVENRIMDDPFQCYMIADSLYFLDSDNSVPYTDSVIIIKTPYLALDEYDPDGTEMTTEKVLASAENYFHSLGINKLDVIIYLEMDYQCTSCWMGKVTEILTNLKNSGFTDFKLVLAGDLHDNIKKINQLTEFKEHIVVDNSKRYMLHLPLFEEMVLFDFRNRSSYRVHRIPANIEELINIIENG